MPSVTTKFDRPDAELVAQLGEFSSATIHEAQGRLGALSSTIKPVDHTMSLCGPAFTVRCAPRDNIMLQVAISYAQPGDVIVVSAGEYAEAGSFGDVLANACIARGLAGLVTDTGVRDTLDLRKLGFPVFSRSVSIKGTVKETIGPLCEPVLIGGELVRPGDVIRADADGVVVVRSEDVASSIENSRRRLADEAGYIAAYHSGKTPIEVSNLAPVLAAKGLVIDE
jgi:4-hydroxy-4-methyl-2-oxoglutarate aldolase